MTETEAIRMFEERLMLDVIESVPDYAEALSTAIAALKEIQQYQKIGTPEKCEEAVEKQKPKPCEFYGDEEDGKLLCPNCGKDLYDMQECGFSNCPYCGQAVTL